MAFRDIFVIVVCLLAAPLALVNAYFGVVMWSWIAYFNPHRYAWGIARYGFFQPALLIAIPTLIGTIFAQKNTRIFVRETLLLAALWFWFIFTTLYITSVPEFAGHVHEANLHLQEVSKILLMTFITILLVTSKKKLRILVLVILASFGLKAFFAALFYLKTGGEFQIWGPEGSFIYDNNDFALAMNMTIPMFFFMARAESKQWVRIILRVVMVCAAICVIGTYSRGGLLGLSAITLALVAKSRYKVFSFLLVAIAVLGVLTLTTSTWHDRMSKFLEGNLDASANSRLVAWGGGWNLAMEYPLTGGGFDVYTDEAIFPSFVPRSLRGALYTKVGHLHSSHSVYFELLGEQGFVGLGLFLLLLGSCFASLRKLRKQIGSDGKSEWAQPYAQMFEVSILAFMVNGATLGRAYFDFLYQIIALVIVVKLLVTRDLEAETWDAQPVERLEAVAT
ncbi:MAG: putative O-glycosylation ligase, exosortase A system-associated [Candidatus Korobacteraceae bacterium]